MIYGSRHFRRVPTFGFMTDLLPASSNDSNAYQNWILAIYSISDASKPIKNSVSSILVQLFLEYQFLCHTSALEANTTTSPD